MKTNSGRYYALPRGHERSALVKRGHTVVAEVFTDQEPGDQYQTATLYAAAPALLAELQGIMAGVAGCQKEPQYEAARAAIANAMGGQP